MEGIHWKDPWPATWNGKLKHTQSHTIAAPIQAQKKNMSLSTLAFRDSHQKTDPKYRCIKRGSRGKDGGKEIESVSGSLKDEAQNTTSLCHWSPFPWRLTLALSFGNNGLVWQLRPLHHEQEQTLSTVVSLQHFVGLNFNTAIKRKGETVKGFNLGAWKPLRGAGWSHYKRTKRAGKLFP